MSLNATTITLLDAGPDHLGRRMFVLDWYDKGGVFRPEPGKTRLGPVGFHRAQVFFCNPARFSEVPK